MPELAPEIAVETLEEFIESIAPDVLACLSQRNFFRRLEVRVWPGGQNGRKVCDDTYAHTVALVTADGYSAADRDDILDVMRSRAGFCDCEVVSNVPPENAIREPQWK